MADIQLYNTKSFGWFKTFFTSLPPPDIDSLRGAYQAQFIGPAWLRQTARPGLALVGLAGWWGKEFFADHIENLMHRDGKFSYQWNLHARSIESLIDGKHGVTLFYDQPVPFPWSLIIDEVRRIDQDTLLGMTLVNTRRRPMIPFPFLLCRNELPNGL